MLVSHEELLAILKEWELRYWTVDTADTSANRSDERYKIRWRVKIAVVNKSLPDFPDFDDGYAMNISPHGLGVITRYALSVGEWCLCFLYPSMPEEPFILLGQVIWQKSVNEVYATGLTYLEWKADDELDAVLDQAKRERQSIR